MMKTFHSRVPLLTLLALASVLAVPSLSAQAVWQRQAFGQQQVNQCDPTQTFNYPNTADWSQELVNYCCDAQCSNGVFTAQPSNWSTPSYPRGGNVVIGGNGGAAVCNVAVTLNNLTITPEGGLLMRAPGKIAANFFNFQGTTDFDTMLGYQEGGGGDGISLVLPAGGTMKKTTGLATFQIDSRLTLQAINGGTIACDAGALQLPGHQSYYVGPLQPVITPMNFDAATGALIDLAPVDAVDAGAVRFAGYITGINTGGTVRLNKGVISTVDDTGGATFNFGGDTFQWQGGAIQSGSANPFVNAGTINVTAGAPSIFGAGFINQGTLKQSATGVLNMPFGSAVTNTLTGVVDIRNDSGITTNGGGGPFPVIFNRGSIRKTAGAGKSTLAPDLFIQNIAGEVRVDSATLALGSGLTSRFGTGDGGTMQVAPGATLELNSGTSYARYHGAYTASGAGKILLNGGTIAPDDSRDGGFTFNFPPGMFEWSGGTIEQRNLQPFKNAGFINVTGPVGIAGNGFVNAGTITQSGAGTINNPFGSAFINTATGLYDIHNPLGMTPTGGGGPFPALNNAGIIRKSAGGGVSLVDIIISNSGMLDVLNGELRFGGFIPNGGTLPSGTYRVIDSGSGATLRLNSAPFTMNDGVVVLSGPNAQFIELDSSLRQNNNTLVLNDGATRTFTGVAGAAARGDQPFATFPNAGTMIIGHNSVLNISGDFAQGSESKLEVVIGPNTATAPVNVSGTAALAGRLEVKLAPGYTPPAGATFPILSAANVTGGFVQVAGASVSYAPNGVIVQPTGNSAALQMTSAVSRKTHDSAGSFDIPLPGVECRRSSDGTHALVFTFSNQIVNGSVTLGGATEASVAASTISGSTMTVNLSNVADVQQLNVQLSNVIDVYSQVLPAATLPVTFLVGDTNGNKTVNATDIGQTKAQSGVPVTSANFRQDVTANGSVSASDIGLVKSRAGATVP